MSEFRNVLSPFEEASRLAHREWVRRAVTGTFAGQMPDDNELDHMGIAPWDAAVQWMLNLIEKRDPIVFGGDK